MPTCENVTCSRYGKPMITQGVVVKQDGPRLTSWRKFYCEQCGGTAEVPA